MPLGVGIVGLGRIARSHAMGYMALANRVEIRAVCDVDEARAHEFAAAFGAVACGDLQDVLSRPDVDAVDLILPHNLHVSAADAVIAAGKHLLIEKPLAPSYRESVAICEAARSGGRVFMVAENTRYVAAYMAADALLRDGAIGEVNNVRTFLSSSMKRRLIRPGFWGREFATGGGLVFDSAPHSFYLLKWLLGEVAEVSASMARVFPLGVEIEDVAEVTGTLATGAHFSCGFSAVSEIPHSERLELYGTTGGIIVDQLADPVVKLFRGYQDHAGSLVPGVPYGPDGWEPGGWHYESVLAEVADFVGAIEEGRPPICDPADAAYAIAVVEAAYASARSRSATPVRLD